MFAQVSVDRARHNFGRVSEVSTPAVFELTNAGDELVTIVSIRVDEGVRVNASNLAIQPGESQYLNVSVKPRSLGPLSTRVEVFTSDSEKPLILGLFGLVSSLAENGRESCASHDGKLRHGVIPATKEFAIRVIDANSRALIRNALLQVSLISGDIQFAADYNGTYNCDLEPGTYRFMVSANGYIVLDSTLLLLASKRDYLLIMKKQLFNDSTVSFTMKECKNSVNINIEDVDQSPEVLVDEEELPIAKVELAPVVELPSEELNPLSEVPSSKTETDSMLGAEIAIADTASVQELNPKGIDTDFALTNYAPCNLVFLIDKSSSMKIDGRLELMRDAIIGLVNFLRPVDKVSLVAYGSDALVILEATSAANKEAIQKALDSMSAGGRTKTGNGLNEAYLAARLGFIQDGNNQVILVTDGSLVITSAKTKIFINENKALGIRLTVMGVKNPEWTETSLKQLAELGGGDYFSIKTVSSGMESLINEIKKKSFIEK